MEPQGNLYAVYGTLRKGFGNHRLLDNEYSERLGTFKTNPEWKMVSLGGFPGVIPNGSQVITVEVYRVTNPMVERRLDMLESYPSFYGKTKIETPWGTADMYTLTEEEYGHLTPVPSGDWIQWTEERTGRVIQND
jgi:gamma-glutamylcyclotransferase (GGCT)/AIG2-like uncharacterized protein YtfP